MKKILFSLIAIALVVGLVGAGAFAYFSDVETSTGNTFSAGTLDLKVCGGKPGTFQDDPYVVHVTLPDLKPGYCSYCSGKKDFGWTLKNEGSITGQPRVEIGPITNYENGCVEPEANDPTNPDVTCGDLQGELGQYLKVSIAYGYDGGTYWCCEGFMQGKTPVNNIGGKSYNVGPVLPPYDNPGTPYHIEDERNVWFMFTLPSDVGNIIQSDSVEFDIIFHLEQVP